MSHRRAWEQLRRWEGTYDFMLVLEDDVCPEAGESLQTHLLEPNAPLGGLFRSSDAWDFVLLGPVLVVHRSASPVMRRSPWSSACSNHHADPSESMMAGLTDAESGEPVDRDGDPRSTADRGPLVLRVPCLSGFSEGC